MASRHVHVVGVRDGVPHPRLVHAGRDRLGGDPHHLGLADVSRHAGGADVRRVRRPHRPSQPAGGDARGLCGAGLHHADADLHRPHHSGLRFYPVGGLRLRASIGPWRPRRAGGQHHAARASDRGDERLPHNDGFGAHRRRLDGGCDVRGARNGAGLYRCASRRRPKPRSRRRPSVCRSGAICRTA